MITGTNEDGCPSEQCGAPAYPRIVILDPGMVDSLPLPLKIEVSRGEQVQFVVFSPLLEVGGCGDSVPDAIRDLCSTLMGLLEAWAPSSSNQLHRSAVEAQARLRGHTPTQWATFDIEWSSR